MQLTIYLILLSFTIISIVQTRSIDSIETDMATEKQLSPDQYSRFLKYLKNRKMNYDADMSSSDTDDTKPMSKRGFFLFPTRRSSSRNRPSYSYGRKSHWDTFFG